MRLVAQSIRILCIIYHSNRNITAEENEHCELGSILRQYRI